MTPHIVINGISAPRHALMLCTSGVVQQQDMLNPLRTGMFAWLLQQTLSRLPCLLFTQSNAASLQAAEDRIQPKKVLADSTLKDCYCCCSLQSHQVAVKVPIFVVAVPSYVISLSKKVLE